ncbi:MAG: hypothetical protein AAGU21_13955 [Solidesulfovibrio sp.]|uniref:hypothetical protein n=1 Tax=Solidesulfovibrio sp. TaxID=2910990 RepID=UPI003158BA1F
MRNLESRLVKLESAVSAPAMVWREPGETVEDAEARHYVAHPEHADRRVLVIGWQEVAA